jgi:hypothetical protein
MLPFIRGGERLLVQPGLAVRWADVVLCRTVDGRTLAHRVVLIREEQERTFLLLQGDARRHPDGLVSQDEVMGRVVAAERGGRRVVLDAGLQRLLGLLWVVLTPLSHGVSCTLLALVRKVRRRLARNADAPGFHRAES